MTLRVAVLAFTQISRDHRVLRTIATLADAGHRVTAIGFGNPPAADCAFAPLPDPPEPQLQRLATVVTQAPANLWPDSAAPLHFWRRHHRAARAALLALALDAIHANDCLALPAASAAKQAHGARIVYDSHEFAVEEHADNWRWRLIAQRHVQALERRFIGQADRIVSVSEGIATDLQALYALATRPTVVRNTPAYQNIALTPLSRPRRLLFHGVWKQGRGIEASIAALRHLSDCELTLRGHGSRAYEASLRQLALRLGVEDRVVFEPPVPHQQVVARAAEAHIGVFCAPTQTRQNRYALPNKIFEYWMAGLATIVTADTELADLTARHGSGVVASAATPDAIAVAISGLSDSSLQTMRGRALEAARELCWEKEQERLRDLYDKLAGAIAARSR